MERGLTMNEVDAESVGDSLHILNLQYTQLNKKVFINLSESDQEKGSMTKRKTFRED